MISLSKGIPLKYNHIIEVPNKGVCQKENSWCFITAKWAQEIEQVTSKLSVKVNLDYVKKIASNTDKPVYVLVYPLKTEIYPEKILYVKHRTEDYRAFSSEAYKQLSTIKLPNFHVINLLPILLKANKKDPDKLSYLIDEHHATEYGNKVVVDYLNNNIPEFAKYNKDFDIEANYPSELYQIAWGGFVQGKNDKNRYGQAYAEVFGWKNRYIKNEYFVPHNYEFYSLSKAYTDKIKFTIDKQCNANIVLHNKNHVDFKVYVLGHSFVETLSKVLATSASDVYRRRVNTPCGAKVLQSDKVIAELKKLNPDVILMAYWNGTFGSIR